MSRPTSPTRGLTAVLVAAVLALTLLGAAPASSAPGPAAAVTAAKAKPAATSRRAPDRYTPRGGVRLNDPLGRIAGRRPIFTHVKRSIESTRGGEVIRIATWNFDSTGLRNALIRAHRRGVAVRLLMQGNMARIQGPRGDFRALRSALKVDKGRPKGSRKSWARTCESSCRGRSGILHTKMYLFTKVRKARDVVMVSSANATDFAATVQWNDVYTVVDRPATHAFFVKIFNEMVRDERAKDPYKVFKVEQGKHAVVLPYPQKDVSKDLVLQRLRRVDCKGATNGAGPRKRRTIVRVAQTAILDERGIAIGRRLKRLHDKGCDVRVLYTVIGPQVMEQLRAPGGRGPVPTREITQDTDGDGVYDRYLHLKVLTVQGVWNGDRNAYMTWNGSENWNLTARLSDEILFQIARRSATVHYNRYMNRLWTNPPRSAPLRARVDLARIDPYAKVEIY